MYCGVLNQHSIFWDIPPVTTFGIFPGSLYSRMKSQLCEESLCCRCFMIILDSAKPLVCWCNGWLLWNMSRVLTQTIKNLSEQCLSTMHMEWQPYALVCSCWYGCYGDWLMTDPSSYVILTSSTEQDSVISPSWNHSSQTQIWLFQLDMDRCSLCRLVILATSKVPPIDKADILFLTFLGDYWKSWHLALTCLKGITFGTFHLLSINTSNYLFLEALEPLLVVVNSISVFFFTAVEGDRVTERKQWLSVDSTAEAQAGEALLHLWEHTAT